MHWYSVLERTLKDKNNNKKNVRAIKQSERKKFFENDNRIIISNDFFFRSLYLSAQSNYILTISLVNGPILFVRIFLGHQLLLPHLCYQFYKLLMWQQQRGEHLFWNWEIIVSIENKIKRTFVVYEWVQKIDEFVYCVCVCVISDWKNYGSIDHENESVKKLCAFV